MGMRANYTAVNDKILEEMLTLDNNGIADKIDKLYEENEDSIYDMDKLWDGLHFLLTGKSADYPLTNNRLNEAITGTDIFDEKGELFIAYTKLNNLRDIVKEMEKIDIDSLVKNSDLEEFKKNDIYPDIWDDDCVFEELKNEFEWLLEFYKKAIENKQNIVVSIY